ncbi:MAG: sigma-54 dependent transcriptional regulator [Myxococcota bacterium]|nr:sigma-54 dependent transcriptional regulator [Myxococcota bacterium]
MPESEKPDAPTLLVVDDEVAVRRSLGRLLSRQGFAVIEAGTLDDALAATAEHDVHVALVDCPLKGTEGTAAVQAIHAASNTTEIVALTAMGSSETSFHVMRSGACDYYEKPISDWHRFFQVINKALEVRNLKAEKIRLSKLRSGEAIEQLIGNSPAMRDLEALIRQVAPTPVPVLIMGESGSGKERVARAVHAASSCKHGPWVAINCAAIPADLLESELFGYEKGGHSQADQRKKGLFELANEGTIFLDEIGEMPMTMQAKLLRVLQEREVQRIGGTSPIAINCRVLAATNRDLRQAIIEKTFREDLFYRLRVVEVRVPPLRERREDIPLLSHYFLDKYRAEFSKSVRRLHPATVTMLQAMDWAGSNVRELEHAIQRAMVLCETDELTPDLFEDGPSNVVNLPSSDGIRADEASDAFGDGLSYQSAKEHVVKVFTVQYLQQRLREGGGNITKAAELSGMLRPNFKKLMKRYGVEVDDALEIRIQG